MRPDTHGPFLRGAAKQKVFERNPHTVVELKELISQVFMDINANQDLCSKMCHSVGDKLKESRFFL